MTLRGWIRSSCVLVASTVCMAGDVPVNPALAELVEVIVSGNLEALASRVAALPNRPEVMNELDARIRDSRDRELAPILLRARGERFGREDQFVELATMLLTRSGEDAPIAAAEMARSGALGRDRLVSLLQVKDAWIRCAVLRALAAADAAGGAAPSEVEQATYGQREDVVEAALAAMASFSRWSPEFESRIPAMLAESAWLVRIAVVRDVLPHWERRDRALALAQAALRDPEPLVVSKSLSTLARLERGDRAATMVASAAAGLLETQCASTGVTECAEALARCGPVGITKLFALAANEDFRAYAPELCRVARRVADESWLSDCASAMRGKSVEARQMAICAVGRVLTSGSPESAGARAAVVAGLFDDSPDVRAAAAEAASAVRAWDREFAGAVADRLGDESKLVRVAAARAIRMHGDRGLLSMKQIGDAAATGEDALRASLLPLRGASAARGEDVARVAVSLIASADALDRWVAAELVVTSPCPTEVRRKVLQAALLGADRRVFESVAALLATRTDVVDQVSGVLAVGVAQSEVAGTHALADVLLERGDAGVAALAREFAGLRDITPKLRLCIALARPRTAPAPLSLTSFELGLCKDGDARVRAMGRTLVWMHSLGAPEPMRK